MIDNRAISKEFADAFLDDRLGAFLDIVKSKENGLQLCFRGNSAPKQVTIYYNNHKVWTISRSYGNYKVTISANHAKGEDKKSLLKALGRLGYKFIVPTNDSYPYFLAEKYDAEFVEKTYHIMTEAIREFFGETDGTNSRYLEKKRQQQLFSYFMNVDTGLYMYDLEFAQKYESKEAREAEGKQNHPDMLAIRYEDGIPKALVLVEVKCTESACVTKGSGILDHIDGMKEYMRSSHMEARYEEASDIIDLYHRFGLRNAPNQIEIPRDEEMIMILTDDAIPYYQRNRGDIDKVANEAECRIYGWDEKKPSELYEIK